ncbi:glucose-6-phosphate dehydrogenase assembly protein OpcA [Demequina sp. TTPB684]|uniref:glucose-6-phosphate dehydrogenase assembly protein OpcA n=1 Tax=unclassified Demequina TaxID=2620311 RepID=UPI001CF41A7D|nr:MULTISPECIES: glucose-6-phosphate dehydrogenase assembly protein OpcA [unclassified Demequina]MCB2411646.1 glucose-6-phosphate dehydrogenase assembly protein OpcA [Demequina sp. TTPB684]UPU89338.1 glucose-6-phosphate dehydrogenase assembly protein OpcA [Demequina sp. TMPB413]
MILELPSTTTVDINAQLLRLRKEGGVITLGRVMTLVIDATDADAEEAISTANVASREHPCRIVVLAPQEGSSTLDAQIRVGGDAGASEVVVLRPPVSAMEHADTLITPLLLPDAPIVAWWPSVVPLVPSAAGLGAMAQRRITDTKGASNPAAVLCSLSDGYRAGDTDLAWTRVTRWRALLASALEQMTDQRVTKARLHGDVNSPSILLFGAWLRSTLGCDFEATYDPEATGLVSVCLDTPAGEIGIRRPDGLNATLSQPGQPDHVITLPSRSLSECLAEELRRMDDDPVYGEALHEIVHC